MAKIRGVGVPLLEYAGVKPYYGIKTGLNAAFLVDTPTRDRLAAEDRSSSEILKPYLRGQDVRRWRAEWAGEWMIFARRGIAIERYPAILRHLGSFRDRLEPKPPDLRGERWPGRKPGTYAWYEIQDSVEYWPLFDEPKIVYQDIVWESQLALDPGGRYYNNTSYFLPTSDLWLLAVLNPPLVWWYSWRVAQHAKDEALRFFSPFVESIPICHPVSDQGLRGAIQRVEELLRVAEERAAARAALLDWLAVEHGIGKPSRRLADPFDLPGDAFVAEVRAARGRRNPLSAAALKSLREEHVRTIEPMAERLGEAQLLERELAEHVDRAYGLTPAEEALLWQTAPPRMPAVPPATSRAAHHEHSTGIRISG